MIGQGRRAAATAASCALLLGLLTSCAAGSDPESDAESDGGTPTLLWLTPPDVAGLAALARECTDAAGGEYRIEVEELPADRSARRVSLIERLRSGHDDVDLVGVETALTAELDASGLLGKLPASREDDLVEDRSETSVAASSVDDRLVTVPWWYEPQVLWFRGSAAERAGLSTSGTVTWDDLVAGAARTASTVQIVDDGGMTTWVNALVAGAGGTLLKGAGEGRDPQIGLDTAAGRRAASIVEAFADAGVGPGPSADALQQFAAPRGAFLVGPSSLASHPDLAVIAGELRAMPYPTTEPDQPGAPLAGVGLAPTASSADPDLALDAIECLTSLESQETLARTTGHTPTRESLLGSTEETTADDRDALVRNALSTGVPEPVSPHVAQLWTAIDGGWSPVTRVDTDTPAETQVAAERLIGGGLP